MLVTMKAVLEKANEENYAVVAPNVWNEMDTRACIAAAEKNNSPLILDVAPNMSADIPLLGSYITKLADDTPIPVAVNLDHGGHSHGAKTNDVIFTDIMLAIKAGFSSVMVDRSSQPYVDNVRDVEKLARMAHSVGITVEAELGHVGDASQYEKDGTAALTDPKIAKEYVEATGVDCLAVAIGNAHGAYKHGTTPYIDFDLLAALKESTGNLPLVLHGGSGTGNDNLYKACRSGINKVNYYTDIVIHVGQQLQKADLSGNNAYEIYTIIQKAYIDKVSEAMDLFGSTGKAWTVEKAYIPAYDMLTPSMQEN